MSLITTQSLCISYGGQEVLHDVNLSITAGEIVTIVGPNGSGKSTLLRAMIGALPPTHGRVLRQDGLRVGYVPQKLHMDAAMPMTVRRFLSLPARVDDIAAARALEAAEVPQLEKRQLAELSGGQFQRVLLARALLRNPHVLMLDEPTQGLDQPGSAAFYRQIEELRNRIGCAVVMVSHELHVVMSASDRVICLNGHVCCEGSPEVVSDAPEYRALFGSGTGGALALYRHDHDHGHDHAHDHSHDHAHNHSHTTEGGGRDD